MYLLWKLFVFDSDVFGVGMSEKRQIFEFVLVIVDVMFQNLDFLEILLMDVSYYFDLDLMKFVQSLRLDKKVLVLYIVDMMIVNVQVWFLVEMVRLDVWMKMLNLKWYEGMLLSGYEGVCEIEKRLINMMGWSVIFGMVSSWQWWLFGLLWGEELVEGSRLVFYGCFGFVLSFFIVVGFGRWIIGCMRK